MSDITVIIPAYNEVSTVHDLLTRLDFSMREKKLKYQVILVDDTSIDGTYEKARRLISRFPLTVIRKKGVQGKAQSILEGVAIAKTDYIVMIDADLQYPPEAIPQMYFEAKEKGYGAVVAKRKVYEESLIRRFGSKGIAFVCGRIMHGFTCDIQSGLKLFRRQIVPYINTRDITPWSLDLPLLHTAKQLGYAIGEVEIDFVKRAAGKSKLALLKPTVQIMHSALKLKFRTIDAEQTVPDAKGSMLGAGVLYKGKKFVTHSTLHNRQSALQVITPTQRSLLYILIGVFLVGLGMNTLGTFKIVVAILSFIYFVDVLFNFYLILKSLHTPPEIHATDEELLNLDEKTLPIYSILCPLYKEAHVIPQFLESIAKIDWPKEKLEVLLLLEEDDSESIEAVKTMQLPSYVKMVVVPDSQPKTKPKACNYGLNIAKGEYLVIYDAEDSPDPKQLKIAYIAFQKVGPQVRCLQAKLNYYNPTQNLLTRLFTAEYSLWFDVILTGLQSIETTIPLGGTSNHFKTNDLLELEGWDPFNVTEDCDLGVRLFKLGYKTAIIDSTTLEEANSDVRNWIRQRSRWIKGYMQTYLLHMRDPISFTKEQGIHALLFQLTVGGKLAFILINPILWLLTISYFALNSIVGPTIESLYPSIVFYMAVTSLIFGNFMFIYYYMIGSAKREHWGLMKWIYLIPIYWLMVSIAGCMALYQLIVKPHYWEKTVHGLHIKGQSKRRNLNSFLRRLPSLGNNSQSPLLQYFSTYKVSGAMVLVIATAANNIFGFLYNTYLGRNVDTTEFGLISLIASLIWIGNIVIGSLSGTVAYRASFLIGKFGGNAKQFWGFIRSRSLAVSVVMTLIWIALCPVFVTLFHAPQALPFLLSAPIWVISFLAAVDRGFLVANFSYISLSVIIVAEGLLKLLVTVLFVHFGISHLVYAAIPLSMVLPLLIGWWVSKRFTASDTLEARHVTYFPKRFFTTSVLMNLSGIAFMSLDIILAKHFLDPVSGGYYTLLSLVGKTIYFVGQLFTQFIYPVISRAEGAGEDTQKAFFPLFLVSTFFTLMTFIAFGPLGRFSIPLLLGQKSLPILPYLFTYTLAFALYTITVFIVTYHQVLRHYVFAAVGFFLAIVQVIVLSLVHENLGVFVNAIFGLSVFYFAVTLGLHVFYDAVFSIYTNFLDFVGLFLKLQGRKPSKGNLRILIFNWRDIRHVWAGGAEVYVHEVARRWVERGHKVTLFCGNDGQHKRNEVIDGVTIVRRGGFYTVYVWAFFYYVFKFRRKYDVVVESENGIPFFTPLYSTRPKVLIIHHVHQEVFRSNLRFPLSLLAQFIESKMMPLVYHNKKIIAVSESTKKDLIKTRIAREQNIEVVNPGITLKSFKKARKTVYPSFIYLGRLQAYKNVDVAIMAFSEVLPALPTAKLTIAGEGDMTEYLHELVATLGIEKSVIFTGKISEAEKIHLLGKHWVAIQPSSFEGWGITVIESNACGTPVIAADVKGLRDSVLDNKTGLLVAEKNADALSKAMLTLSKDKALREKLSRSAYEWAQNFDWQKSTLIFEQIIEKKIIPEEENIDPKTQVAVNESYE